MKQIAKRLSVILGLGLFSVHSLASAAAGTDFDLQGFIDGKLAAGERRVVVPPGIYRVVPKNREHLVLRDLNDVEIVCKSVEMRCTETTRALSIQGCRNVTLSGLTIDYDPLCFTQGRITGFQDNKRIQEVELFDGYPPAAGARAFKYEIFRPDTRTLRCEDRGVKEVEVVDQRHLRVILHGAREENEEQVGDLVVIGSEHAPGGSIPHAVECARNVNVKLRDMTLYGSNCFGFLEYECDGSIYERCRINRRDAADDFKKRGDARLRSLNADAFHSKHAVKGPRYLACEAAFMADDAVNINGDYHMVMASKGVELRVLAKHGMNIKPGDPLEVVDYSGRRLPDAKAVSVEEAGEINDEERGFLSRQQMDAGLKSGEGPLTRAFRVTVDRSLDLPMGSVVCSANRIGNGFKVKGCTFGYNRSRAILIKASHGEVSGNTIVGSRMHAILVSPEYWWLEAGSSSDVVIRDNRIRDCLRVPILVQATGGDGKIALAGAHDKITISGNQITGCSMPGILVTSTSNLRLEGNRFDSAVESGEIPGLMRQAGVIEIKPVVTIQCTAD